METQRITDPKIWQSLTDRTEASLPQRWIYGAACEKIGRSVERFAVTQDGHTVALAQIVKRRMFGLEVSLATGGPLILDPSQTKAAFKALRSQAHLLSLNLMTPAQHYHWPPLSAAPTICDIDLSQDIECLRAAQHVKWRNALKKSEKTSLKVARVTATPDALMPLLRAEKERQKAKLYQGLPPEFTLALQATSPKSLILYGARDAQMLFIRHGNSASYHMGFTGPEGRAANAHNLILWHAVQQLKSLGVTRLDLGTIEPKHAPDLARFKLRSGAQMRRLAPAQLM